VTTVSWRIILALLWSYVLGRCICASHAAEHEHKTDLVRHKSFMLWHSITLTLLHLECYKGRAVARAISHWLITATARIRALVRSCGICGGQSDTEGGLLRVRRVPLSVIPLTAPHSSSSIIWGWYKKPSSGRRTSIHSKKLKRGGRGVKLESYERNNI
jgi:hypothetical protein